MHRRMTVREIFIDLTALLDVILILLFLVMMKSNQTHRAERSRLETDNAIMQATVSQLGQARDEALAAAHLENADQAALSAFLNESATLVLSLPTDPSQDRPRIALPDGQTLVQSTQENFEAFLSRGVMAVDKRVIVFVLSYDNQAILWRNYRRYLEGVQRFRANQDRTILYTEVQENDRDNGGYNHDKNTKKTA